MDTYSFISENGTIHEIADLAAREKNTQQDTTISTFDGRINEAYQKAESVEGIAQNAQTTANSAQTTANSAQTTANTANTKATAAQTTANTANTTANNALSRANTANTKATSAQATANTANTTANNALTRANTVGGERLAKTAIGTSPSGSTVYKQTWKIATNDQQSLNIAANSTLLDYKVIESRLANTVTTWITNVSHTFNFTNTVHTFKGGDTTSGTKTYYLTVTWVEGTY